MAAITSSILAIAAGAQAAMTIKQGQDAKAAANIQAKQIRAEQNNAELTTAEQMKRERVKSARAISSIRAKLAQTGTVTTSGTPLAILGENAQNIELGFQDAARASAMQSTAMTAQAQQAQFAGKQAYTASLFTAAGQLAQGAATFKNYDAAVFSGKYKDTFSLYPTRRS